MTSPHASAPDPTGGLDPADIELLTPDAARADHSDPVEPVDWHARVMALAERSRPVREEQRRIRTARQQKIDAARRDRAILACLDRLDRRFGRYSDAVVEQQPIVARWALDTIRGGRSGLVIRGAVGVGKTHVAVAAYRAAVAGGVLPAIAVAVPALLDGLRPGRETVEDLRACEDARLLLLDDLAAERVTDWTSETLYRLIDARYSRRLPTLVTTNATGQQIRDGLGPRVASRLNGLGQIVTLEGPDRRTAGVD